MKKIHLISLALFVCFAVAVSSCKDDPEPMPPDLSVTPHTVTSLIGHWIIDSSVTLTVYQDNSKPIESVSGLVDGYYDFVAGLTGDYKWAPDHGTILSSVISGGGLIITIQVHNNAQDKNESYVYKVMQNKPGQNIWQTESAYYKNALDEMVKNIKKVYLRKI